MAASKWCVRGDSGLIEILWRPPRDNHRALQALDEYGRRACSTFAKAKSKAEHGDPIGVLNVAVCYLWGIGVGCNLALSILWSERAVHAKKLKMPVFCASSSKKSGGTPGR